MRELLLIVGLMSLGCFTQSLLNLAMGRSCEIYELVRHDKPKVQQSLSRQTWSSVPSPTVQQALWESAQRADERDASSGQAQMKGFALTKLSNRTDVDVSQNSIQPTRAIR